MGSGGTGGRRGPRRGEICVCAEVAKVGARDRPIGAKGPFVLIGQAVRYFSNIK